MRKTWTKEGWSYSRLCQCRNWIKTKDQITAWCWIWVLMERIQEILWPKDRNINYQTIRISNLDSDFWKLIAKFWSVNIRLKINRWKAFFICLILLFLLCAYFTLWGKDQPFDNWNVLDQLFGVWLLQESVDEVQSLGINLLCLDMFLISLWRVLIDKSCLPLALVFEQCRNDNIVLDFV